ncbi:hypothetical protein ABZT04_34330 [Streptomyces sp. NPDC005492]
MTVLRSIAAMGLVLVQDEVNCAAMTGIQAVTVASASPCGARRSRTHAR